MQTKTKKREHKRHGKHHKVSQKYKNVYWPYIPLLAIGVILSVVAWMPFNKSNVLKYATEMSRGSLLAETNTQRTSHNRSQLTMDETLNKAAQAKAEDMAKRNYWSHKTPEGYEPWVFIDQAGYDYQKAGENLAYGFGSSLATVVGWMNSPSHRDNLLDEAYTQVGFGFANASSYQGTSEETIVVAMYGRPASLGAHINSDAVPLQTSETKPVLRAETLNRNFSFTPFFVGILGGSAASGLLLSHSLRLRRLLKKGEQYFVAHPLLDISLVLIAVACIGLSRTVGYIL